MSNAWHVRQAMRALDGGEVIAYPTEAIWGLGCNPADEVALERLLALKHRPWQKGLILVADNLDQLDNWLFPLSGAERQQVEADATVSWLLPCRESVPQRLRGVHSTIAVRLSAHKTVKALCQAYGPLVSTSANPASLAPAKTPVVVRRYFGNRLGYIVPGQLGGRLEPSQIKTLAGTRLR